jgi:hypothetical protein
MSAVGYQSGHSWLGVNGRDAGPPKAFLADPDVVLQRSLPLLHQVEKMIAGVDDDGAGLFPDLILNHAIGRAGIARLGLRCYATRQRQGAGNQRDEGAARRLICLIAHGLSPVPLRQQTLRVFTSERQPRRRGF